MIIIIIENVHEVHGKQIYVSDFATFCICRQFT